MWLDSKLDDPHPYIDWQSVCTARHMGTDHCSQGLLEVLRLRFKQCFNRGYTQNSSRQNGPDCSTCLRTPSEKIGAAACHTGRSATTVTLYLAARQVDC